MRLLVLLALATLPASAHTEPVRIVVLGSSNTAGTGPSTPDSAWVNRLRAHLAATRPGSEVVNRARGGTLTDHLMPTGTTPPAGRQRPDAERNITRAVAPDAIAISLTSNDAELGYTAVEQLEHYQTMLDAAGDSPVPVTTTTPRSFWRANGAESKASKRRIQAVPRASTLARHGDRGIDFWTTLATADSIPAAATSAGDGVHFNNAGHRIFFERVLDSPLIDAAVATSGENEGPADGLGLRVLLNPSPSPTVEVVSLGGPTCLDVFDACGRRAAPRRRAGGGGHAPDRAGGPGARPLRGAARPGRAVAVLDRHGRRPGPATGGHMACTTCDCMLQQLNRDVCNRPSRRSVLAPHPPPTP